MARARASWLRRLRQISPFILMGLVSTIATSTLFAQGWWNDRARMIPTWFFESEESGAVVSWWTFEDFGFSSILAHRSWRAGAIRRRPDSPLWSEMHLRPQGRSYVQATGWPWRALKAGITADRDVWGAVRFGEPRHTGMFGRSILVPFAPVWSGLIANTLFYGAVCFAVMQLVGLARRRGRIRRGLCPLCRYDLQSDYSRGCSECGWNR